MQASPLLVDRLCELLPQIKSFMEIRITNRALNILFLFCFPITVRYLTGMVDKSTLEKYEREAKEKNRETW